MKVEEDEPNRFSHKELETRVRDTLYRSAKETRRVTAIQTSRFLASVATQ